MQKLFNTSQTGNFTCHAHTTNLPAQPSPPHTYVCNLQYVEWVKVCTKLIKMFETKSEKHLCTVYVNANGEQGGKNTIKAHKYVQNVMSKMLWTNRTPVWSGNIRHSTGQTRF